MIDHQAQPALHLTAAEQVLADLIGNARGSKMTVPGKNPSPGVELSSAYRIQQANGHDRVLKGYKLGLVSPAKQAQMGIDSPIYGRIYADAIYQNTIALGDFVQPRVEPELAVVLRDPVAPGASAGAVSAAIGGYFLGVDILDSIWQDFKFTAAEVVADNASGGGFLLGGRMTDGWTNGALRLYFNGDLQAEGHTEALGSPVQRLQWLAHEVGGLAAGAMVFFGSPAAAVPARPGVLEVVGPDGDILVARIVA
ncbi:MAG: fumarylacetoacetate hydrolase family protein [Anaerolineae bacterium]|nr:fumarylacetoacetate hydrolase family protein [Anaerolineae bacterium]